MCGYLFLGTAFGATLAQAGFGPVWALAMSGLVYAGSLQFVMVPLMANSAALATVALTALMVNARHLFYGVSYIDRFGKMGRLRPYMIYSLTDETYSVFCGLPGEESNGVMLRVALYDHLYWVTGSVVGGVLAQQRVCLIISNAVLSVPLQILVRAAGTVTHRPLGVIPAGVFVESFQVLDHLDALVTDDKVRSCFRRNRSHRHQSEHQDRCQQERKDAFHGVMYSFQFFRLSVL
jgi:hypothetical protein